MTASGAGQALSAVAVALMPPAQMPVAVVTAPVSEAPFGSNVPVQMTVVVPSPSWTGKALNHDRIRDR
jgi:hypothetical protein